MSRTILRFNLLSLNGLRFNLLYLSMLEESHIVTYPTKDTTSAANPILLNPKTQQQLAGLIFTVFLLLIVKQGSCECQLQQRNWVQVY